MSYLHGTNKPKPQTKPQREDQIKNRAGGYVFAISDEQRFLRWLILGTASGTYYQGQREMTADAVQFARAFVRQRPHDALQLLHAVSTNSRAIRNDECLYALALVAAHDDQDAKENAYRLLPDVARIPTHLFMFLEFSKHLRGHGSGFRRAISRWYNQRSIGKLTYQMLKYRQREGWTHGDVMRVAHPTPGGADHSALYKWAVKGFDLHAIPPEIANLRLVDAFLRLQTADNPTTAAQIITDTNAPWEFVKPEHLNTREVRAALLPNMPTTALLRQLGIMGSAGVLLPGAWDEINIVRERLNANNIKRARVHPLAVLTAWKTYASGQGVRGRNKWEPVGMVKDVLEHAFYAAFESAEPTGRRHVVAVDVSPSMLHQQIGGLPNVTAAEAAATLALLLARTEPDTEIVTFAGVRGRRESAISPCDIDVSDNLDSAMRKLDFGGAWGGTDCALPFLWARERHIHADVFVMLTDNETWQGTIHPHTALESYRQHVNLTAKFAAVAMTATNYSVGDTSDGGTMNFVGMDAQTPRAVAEFTRE